MDLTLPLLDLVRQSTGRPVVGHLVDVDERALDQAARPLHALGVKGEKLQLVSGDLREWLAESESSDCDLLLLSHVMYYVDESDWADVVDRAVEGLSGDGRVVFVVRSREAAFWRALDPVLDATRASGGSSHLFADLLKKRVAEQAIIEASSSCEYIVAFEDVEELIRIAAFLYRLPPDLLDQPAVRRALEQVFEEGVNSVRLVLGLRDEIFSIAADGLLS